MTVALSFLFGLTPTEVRAALERRVVVLRENLARLDRELKAEGGPPRLFLLETEYLRTVTAAELDWVNALVEDLRSGTLPAWKHHEIAELAQQFLPPD